MATRKTTNKASKTSSKSAKTTTKKATSASMSTKKQNSMSVTGLRKHVRDPKNRKSLLIAISIILVVIILFFGRGLFVAATVNGEPISRLTILRDLEKQSGGQALDAVVTRAIIIQEGNKKKIVVTEKDIDNEIAKIKKQFDGQGQNLDQLLAAQGLTQEKFREEVRIQLLVTKILGDQAKVTDKEFQDFMAKNPDLLENEKDKKTATANLRTQMEQQKLAQKYQEWIANLKKSAKIQYFVNYGQ